VCFLKSSNPCIFLDQCTQFISTARCTVHLAVEINWVLWYIECCWPLICTRSEVEYCAEYIKKLIDYICVWNEYENMHWKPLHLGDSDINTRLGGNARWLVGIHKAKGIWRKFDVCTSLHHHTIQINQPTRCNSFPSLLLDVYVWLNRFRTHPRPPSGAYKCISSLWFYRWSVMVAALLVVVWPVLTGETTTNSTATATLQL
jgi:hypothetical protein